jgi:hypothetical protein
MVAGDRIILLKKADLAAALRDQNTNSETALVAGTTSHTHTTPLIAQLHR